jgi:RHS repeat-associated protein
LLTVIDRIESVRAVGRTISPNTTRYAWNESGLLHETDASLVAQAQYTDLPGIWGSKFSVHRSGGSAFYVPDHQGNSRVLTDATGAVSDTLLTDAWGVEVAASGATVNPYRAFGAWGYERDAASRLYVRARHLRVDLGRWVSRDPIGFYGGDWNLYGYAENEPSTGADPTGEREVPKIRCFRMPKCRTVTVSHPGRGSVTKRCCTELVLIAGAEACYELCTATPGHPTGPFTRCGEQIGHDLYPDPDPDPNDPGDWVDPDTEKEKCVVSCARSNMARVLALDTAYIRAPWLTPRWCQELIRYSKWTTDCYQICLHGCQYPPYKPGRPRPANKCSLSYARRRFCLLHH